jgi:hypothetical protein
MSFIAEWYEEFTYWVETIARFMIDATDYYVRRFAEEIKNE